MEFLRCKLETLEAKELFRSRFLDESSFRACGSWTFSRKRFLILYLMFFIRLLPNQIES